VARAPARSALRALHRLAGRRPGSLGAIAGALIIDHWLLRERTLDLTSLHVAEGADRQRNGYHLAAIGSSGRTRRDVLGSLRPICDLSWSIGFVLEASCTGR
jgi:cytosine/uracil/thiamine/allantoin permease